MCKLGLKSYYESTKLLNWSQSHTVYRRSLFYWISAKIVCFHHNILSFNIFSVWNYGMLIPNKNVVRQSYQSLMFIKWHTVTLKAYSYPYSSKEKMTIWDSIIIRKILKISLGLWQILLTLPVTPKLFWIWEISPGFSEYHVFHPVLLTGFLKQSLI